jgi:glycosyltransferase involved in cell wall biosynthesis
MLLPARVKLVLGVFGFHQFNPGDTGAVASAYRKAFYAYSLARSARIVLNSRYSQEILESSARVDSGHIDILAHGRDEELFHAGPLTSVEQERFAALGLPLRYICFVSQMYPYKNVECAVEGYCRFVQRTGASQGFVLVGQFDTHGGAGLAYKRQLIEIATSHGLADRLIFLENISAKILRAIYLGADAYIQSSLAETFGKTTVEAMACGCPVIAARAAATPEVLGDAGLYYEPRDAEHLANQLISVAADPALASDLRERGLARAELFSIREEARLLSEVFKRAAGR